MIGHARTAVHLTVFGLAAIWIELAFGRLDFWLPSGMLFAFYLSVCRGWRFAACWSTGAALVLGDLAGYCAWPGFLLCLAAAQIWRRSGDRSRLVVQLFPAFASLLLACFVTLAIENTRHGDLDLHRAVLQLLSSSLAGALAFPFLLWVWDASSERLGLPSYDSGVELIQI